MEQSQFEVLSLAIVGLGRDVNTKFDQLERKIDALDAKIDGLEEKMDREFIEVNRSLELIARQTARTVEDVKALDKRVTQFESPRA